MHNAEKSASEKANAKTTRLRRLRRLKRLDMLIASTLLLLLIFGWVVYYAPLEQWTRGDALTAGRTAQV